jgi:hypothetical protein
MRTGYDIRLSEQVSHKGRVIIWSQVAVWVTAQHLRRKKSLIHSLYHFCLQNVARFCPLHLYEFIVCDKEKGLVTGCTDSTAYST